MKIIRLIIFTSIALITLLSKSQNLSLKLDKDQSLNYHSIFQFNVEYKKDGKTFSTQSIDKKNLIKWSKLNVNITNGEYLKQGLIKIDRVNSDQEFNSIIISIEHKKNHFKLDTLIPLNYSGLEILNFNALDGKEVKNGPKLHLFSKILSEITNTDIQPTASNGKRGNNGQNGLSINVLLEWKTINGQELLKISCTNDNQEKLKSVYIDPKNGQAKLLAIGGKSSKGGKGEILQKDNGKYEKGKPGRDGNNGLDGHFDVFVTEKMYPYLKNIRFITTNRHNLAVKPILKKGPRPDSNNSVECDGEVHVYIVE